MSGGLLAGKSAVVTGGANGMGAGIVRVFAESGADRGVVLDLPGALGRTPIPEGWIEVPVDLREDASVDAAFERVRDFLGTIDVLVAAAGIVPAWTTIGSLDLSEWDDLFSVNTRGVLCSIRGVLPAFADDGSMIVIASQNAWRGSANLPGYTASKHAVLGLVRSAALEFGPRGIRVNAVGPGSIATEAYLSRLRQRESENGLTVAEALEGERLTTARRRLATVDEVANGILFLASGLSSGITGVILPIGASVT
jgi:3-oxoacyl-[acyl-carrier protein] reductase